MVSVGLARFGQNYNQRNYVMVSGCCLYSCHGIVIAPVVVVVVIVVVVIMVVVWRFCVR